MHDLKRWITSPNQTISGEECISRADDSRFFKRSPRFTDEHFRECIQWAVVVIKQLHDFISIQIDYLGADPYTWKFFEDPISEAFALDKLPTPEATREMRGGDLVRWMVELGVEIDYLSEHICVIRKEILQLKWQRAKMGYWGEIFELVESGFVDVEHVQKWCNV